MPVPERPCSERMVKENASAVYSERGGFRGWCQSPFYIEELECFSRENVEVGAI